MNRSPGLAFSVLTVGLGLLGVVLSLLKLADVIKWPWMWVLAPWWGGYLLSGLLLTIALIIALPTRGVR